MTDAHLAAVEQRIISKVKDMPEIGTDRKKSPLLTSRPDVDQRGTMDMKAQIVESDNWCHLMQLC